MHLAEHYLHLRKKIPAVDSQPLELPLEEVADALCCTRRNARLILQKLQDLGWLRWVPGRGRGHRSHLTFLAPLETAVSHLADEIARRDDLTGALAQMKRHLADALVDAPQFLDWFSRHLGYQEGETQKGLDTLRFPIQNWTYALDPAHIYTFHESRFVRQLFNTLLTFDERTQTFAPQLAHHWEADASGTVWTFWLRKGVRFHHGRPLTAHDVAYTLQRLLDPAVSERYAHLMLDVRDIRVIKDTVLQIELSRPNYSFLHFLSTEAVSIVPRDVIQEQGAAAFSRFPVGTGPFRLTEHHDAMIVLEAFDDYFLERPHLDRIEMWRLPPGTRLSDVKELGGEHVPYVPYHTAEPLSDWQQTPTSDRLFIYLMFNLAKPGPGRDPRIRRALQLAIDRARLVEQLGLVRHAPADGLLDAPPENLDHFRGNADLARDLLREAEYDGTPLHLYTDNGFLSADDASFIQQAAREIGLVIEVTHLTYRDFIRQLQQADLIHFGWYLDINIEISMLDFLQGATLAIRWLLDRERAADIDLAVCALQREPSRETRLHLLREAGRLLTADHAMIGLYHTRQEATYHPSLQGLANAPFGWDHFRSLWFK